MFLSNSHRSIKRVGKKMQGCPLLRKGTSWIWQVLMNTSLGVYLPQRIGIVRDSATPAGVLFYWLQGDYVLQKYWTHTTQVKSYLERIVLRSEKWSLHKRKKDKKQKKQKSKNTQTNKQTNKTKQNQIENLKHERHANLPCSLVHKRILVICSNTNGFSSNPASAQLRL